VLEVLARPVVGASLALALSFTAWAADLPDPAITPGSLNPRVTQGNIQQTVCVKGYTKTIRPPAHVTNKLKKWQIRAYGYTDTNPKHYEEDHLISLELGGEPLDRKNLWPEPWYSEWNARRKDELENALHRMVCDGEITLRDAQTEIAADWIAAFKKYVH
jgi:hypothetical protein